MSIYWNPQENQEDLNEGLNPSICRVNPKIKKKKKKKKKNEK